MSSNGPPQRDGKAPSCDPPSREPFQPTPIPLLENKTVVEQPAGLFTLAAQYSAAAINFIAQQTAASTPFFLYFPFNHIHAPSSCGETSCGRSTRGPVGDATQEVDSVVGEVMETIRSTTQISNNTLVFFTSVCPCHALHYLLRRITFCPVSYTHLTLPTKA